MFFIYYKVTLTLTKNVNFIELISMKLQKKPATIYFEIYLNIQQTG